MKKYVFTFDKVTVVIDYLFISAILKVRTKKNSSACEIYVFFLNLSLIYNLGIIYCYYCLFIKLFSNFKFMQKKIRCYLIVFESLILK